MLEESALRTVLKPPGANSFNKRKQPCHPCVSPCGTRVKYQPTLSASSLSSVLRHLSSELCLQPQTQWSSALTRHPWCLMPYAHRLFNQNRPERMKVNKLRTSLTYNNFPTKESSGDLTLYLFLYALRFAPCFLRVSEVNLVNNVPEVSFI